MAHYTWNLFFSLAVKGKENKVFTHPIVRCYSPLLDATLLIWEIFMSTISTSERTFLLSLSFFMRPVFFNKEEETSIMKGLQRTLNFLNTLPRVTERTIHVASKSKFLRSANTSAICSKLYNCKVKALGLEMCLLFGPWNLFRFWISCKLLHCNFPSLTFVPQENFGMKTYFHVQCRVWIMFSKWSIGHRLNDEDEKYWQVPHSLSRRARSSVGK